MCWSRYRENNSRIVGARATRRELQTARFWELDTTHRKRAESERRQAERAARFCLAQYYSEPATAEADAPEPLLHLDYSSATQQVALQSLAPLRAAFAP
eukprot:COSAG02_NODE_26479_length_632_cov_0.797373_1_plen_98_part_10